MNLGSLCLYIYVSVNICVRLTLWVCMLCTKPHIIGRCCLFSLSHSTFYHIRHRCRSLFRSLPSILLSFFLFSDVVKMRSFVQTLTSISWCTFVWRSGSIMYRHVKKEDKPTVYDIHFIIFTTNINRMVLHSMLAHTFQNENHHHHHSSFVAWRGLWRRGWCACTKSFSLHFFPILFLILTLAKIDETFLWWCFAVWICRFFCVCSLFLPL